MKKKHITVLLERIMLNSIQNITIKLLRHKEISRDDFTIFMNDAENYLKLKVNLKIMKSQKSNIERDKLINGGTSKGLNLTYRYADLLAQKYEKYIFFFTYI